MDGIFVRSIFARNGRIAEKMIRSQFIEDLTLVDVQCTRSLSIARMRIGVIHQRWSMVDFTNGSCSFEHWDLFESCRHQSIREKKEKKRIFCRIVRERRENIFSFAYQFYFSPLQYNHKKSTVKLIGTAELLELNLWEFSEQKEEQEKRNLLSMENFFIDLGQCCAVILNHLDHIFDATMNFL